MFARDADPLMLDPKPRRGSEAISLTGRLRIEIQKAKARVYRLAGRRRYNT